MLDVVGEDVVGWGRRGYSGCVLPREVAKLGFRVLLTAEWLPRESLLCLCTHVLDSVKLRIPGQEKGIF